jgi:amidase
MDGVAEWPKADHTLARDSVVYALDRDHEPRLAIDPGTVVTIETHDARGGRLKHPDQVEETAPDFSERFPKANPATGPIYVRGAAPGSSVTVDILAIDLDPAGFILMKPDTGILRGLSPRPLARMCPVRDGEVHFGGLRFPVRPMVGVLGVAPAGEAIGTAYVGDHGGNIDTILAAVGSRMILRAQVEGALVYVGDVHAAMGDGEVSGAGVEIGARVTVRIGVGEHPAKRWPRLETRDRLVAIACAPTFEAASAIVVEEMVGDLMERHDLAATDAFMLISAIGDLRVNQACRSKVDVSLRLEMPRF